MREEGHYNIKRVDKLPKRGNSNFLYSVKDENEMLKLYRWRSNGIWEEITVGGGVSFTDIYGGNALIDGDVVHLQNLDYYVWSTAYIIDNIHYTDFVNGNVTLDPAHATEKRIDVFVINDDGAGNKSVGVVKGDTDPTSPVKPNIDLSTQVEVSFKILAAAETVPPEITNINIYDENLGDAGGEWDNSVVGGNPADTSDFFSGILSYDIPSPSTIVFDTPSPVAYDSTATLVFQLKTDSSWNRNSRIRLRFSLGAVNSNNLTINRSNGSQYNFDHNLIGEWQTVSVSLLAMNNIPTTIDTLRILSQNTPNLQIDKIRIQGGIPVASADFVQSVVAGLGIAVDDTDPQNPIVSTNFEGYNESGTRAGGDLIAEVGDYDGSGNGTDIQVDDANNRVTINGDFTITNSAKKFTVTGGGGTGDTDFGSTNITVGPLSSGVVIGTGLFSIVWGQAPPGETNEVSGSSCLAVGRNIGATADQCQAFGQNTLASQDNAAVFGLFGISGGFSSFVAGTGGVADGVSETLFGVYPTIWTNTSVSQTIPDAGDRVFAVGVGLTASRKDGVNVLFDGTVTFPELSNAKIETAGVQSAITKGYLDQRINRVKVSLSAAEIKALGTTPIDAIAAPGVGKVTIVKQMMVKATWGSVAFDNNNLSVIQETGNLWIFGSPFPLNFTADKYLVFPISGIAGTGLTTNVKTQLTGIDSVATGDSTIDVYITYEIITL